MHATVAIKLVKCWSPKRTGPLSTNGRVHVQVLVCIQVQSTRTVTNPAKAVIRLAHWFQIVNLVYGTLLLVERAVSHARFFHRHRLHREGR